MGAYDLLLFRLIVFTATGKEVAVSCMPGRRTYRDTALFAAMLVILSGVGLAPLGGLSPATGIGSAGSPWAEVSFGQRMEQEHLAQPPASPPPVGDPERIRRLLPAGSTREVLVKGGYVARLAATMGPANDLGLAYAFQTLTARTIESNDGRRIVERLHFQKRDLMKVVASHDGLRFRLGPPGEPWPDSFNGRLDGNDRADVPVETVECISVTGSTPEEATSRAVVAADSLAGKTVRVTYVDGAGVESVEPIGCRLSGAEAVFLFHTAVLADLYILPHESCDAGRKWSFGAEQLVGFLDPALPAAPAGRISLRRDVRPGLGRDGAIETAIRLDRHGWDRIDLVPLRVPDENSRDRFRFLAYYALDDARLEFGAGGLLETARLDGFLEMVSVWQDFFLFDELIKGSPRVSISYHCKVDSLPLQETPQ